MKEKELFGWVLGGKQRMAIIKAMDREKIQRDIRKDAKQYSEKISRSSTSRILKSFVERGIAVCSTENRRVGKLYELTRSGKEIRGEVVRE